MFVALVTVPIATLFIITSTSTSFMIVVVMLVIICMLFLILVVCIAFVQICETDDFICGIAIKVLATHLVLLLSHCHEQL